MNTSSTRFGGRMSFTRNSTTTTTTSRVQRKSGAKPNNNLESKKIKIKMFISYVSNQLECDCMLHDNWLWVRFLTVDNIRRAHKWLHTFLTWEKSTLNIAHFSVKNCRCINGIIAESAPSNQRPKCMKQSIKCMTREHVQFSVCVYVTIHIHS